MNPNRAWLARFQHLTRQTSRQLGGMVVMVAMEPGGHLAVDVAGAPASGPLHEEAKDLPHLLETVAAILRTIDQAGTGSPPNG